MFLVRTLSIPEGSLTKAVAIYTVPYPGLVLLMVAVELVVLKVTPPVPKKSQLFSPKSLLHRMSDVHSLFSILHRSVLCGRGPDMLLMKTIPRSRETGLLKVEHILSVQLLWLHALNTGVPV